MFENRARLVNSTPKEYTTMLQNISEFEREQMLKTFVPIFQSTFTDSYESKTVSSTLDINLNEDL